MDSLKTIYLLRHAKSDWEAEFRFDHERPISERGRKNAKALRNFLQDRNFQVDKAYVSDAKRTIETLEIINKDKDLFKEIEITHLLYEANFGIFFNLITTTEDSCNSILFLGHNPDLEELANQLMLRQNAYKEFSFFQKFGTSSIIGLAFPISSWKNISEYPGKLTLFWTPAKK
ncbi:MAG TPA: histidine phosphatase family protein [Leptospiraceae bacterium]|nr:histidine phosphatase family protein [Leptospiraceae bacterium]HMX33468.1 histidine phosphatase family protein [Leptospiraceae bacterium]HMY29575.1 histidine phosphatase family protein [Leptospiraceae bacterium]HMZ62935.1 histidine phosphatase family protein [Leptospiraceae bacterium]HNA05986.1 histidine phosphatase family protein [Leptospiraceae bacterium]